MSQLQSGHELCDKCGKPYIAALNRVSCSCIKVEPVEEKILSYTELKESNKAMYDALKAFKSAFENGVIKTNDLATELAIESAIKLGQKALALASPGATDRKIEELVGDGS